MAAVKTMLYVDFQDDAGRVSTIGYRMATEAEDDGSNMGAVLTAAGAIVTALEAISWDAINHAEVRVVAHESANAPNDASSNGSYAFIRTTLDDDPTEKGYVVVPAWSATLFEEAQNGVLDAAFNVAAATLINLLKDPETGSDMSLEYSQARERKVFKRNLG